MEYIIRKMLADIENLTKKVETQAKEIEELKRKTDSKTKAK